MKLSKGILIVIEGIDGSGKTTQAEILLEKLRGKGFDTVYFREPSDGKWGREIKRKATLPDSISPDEELDLFLKDRRENVEKNLKPGLEEKKIVVLDRYYFSTMAYQGALGLDQKKIRSENEAFAPIPDLVILLTIPVSKGLSRIKEKRGDFTAFEGREYLNRVKLIFEDFVAPLKNVVTIDGMSSEDDVFSEMKDQVMKIIVPLKKDVND